METAILDLRSIYLKQTYLEMPLFFLQEISGWCKVDWFQIPNWLLHVRQENFIFLHRLMEIRILFQKKKTIQVRPCARVGYN